jgi:NTP pyrophosphatase (non-canonical NTP hydrolase)
MMSSTLDTLSDEILRFRDERDWGQFHTPRHLAAALCVEGAELQELMLWLDDQGVEALLADESHKGRVRHEIADVLIFALLFCNAANIDPTSAIREKLAANALKYPVDRSKGRATKYTEL